MKNTLFKSLGLVFYLTAIFITLIINISAIAYLYPDYYKSIVMLRFSALTSLSSIIFAYIMYKVGNKFISISKANNVT